MSELQNTRAEDAAMRRRIMVVCGLLVVGLSALSVRLVWLQVVNDEYYAEHAERYYVDEEELPPSRGRIIDRNGDLLARSQTVYRLIADANHLRDDGIAEVGVAQSEGLSIREVRRKYSVEEISELYLTEVVRVLAKPLGVPNWELRQKFDKKKAGYIVLKRGLPEDDHRAMADLLRESKIGGVYFRQETQRFYPSPDRLTHVLGYVDAEGNGKTGVEKIAEEYLQGEAGFRFLERDRRGREIVVFRGESKQPTEGHTVRLTIDMALQCIVENALAQAVDMYQPEKATIILMDPATGAVVAMASRPDYNLVTREGLRRNPAVSDLYEPGSTFKVVALAGALDRRLINLRTPIYCEEGIFEFDGLTLEDHHPYGELSAQMVFAKSSNIGTFKIARQLSADSFYSYMRSFGFGQKTGIDLTAEAGGTVKRVENWSTPSLSRMGMGYEVSVTPLQMVAAYGAIANGGELMKPMVVSSIEDSRGRVVEKFEPETVRRVISEQAAARMREAMMAVVGEDGTGELAAVPGHRVAGKTGTARKYSPENGEYLHGRYVVSFAGFFPAEDPKLVGLVVIDDPVAEGVNIYGGTIAGPIFSRIAGAAATYLNIEPSYTEDEILEISQSISGGLLHGR